MSRFRPAGGSRWNPADHPRGPLGRFVDVNGSGRMGTDYGDDSSLRPPSWGDLDGLSPISGHIPSQMQTRDLTGIDTSIGADRTRMSPEPYRGSRPQMDRFEWRANEDGANAAIADIDSFVGPTGSGLGSGSVRLSDDVQELGHMGALNQGVRRGYLVDAESGRELDTGVVIKKVATADEADAELLASEVGHAIGAPVPYVRQNPTDNREVIMEAAPGSMGFAGEAPTMRDGRESMRNFREGGARLAVLDQLISNRDRHGGNWIMGDGTDTPIGIDNGLAWGAATGEPMRTAAEIRHVQTNILGPLEGGGGYQGVADWATWSDRISLEEMKLWPAHLRALRPEFEKRGRGAWHDHMMNNYRDLLREKMMEED